jgi:hypothetical protein
MIKSDNKCRTGTLSEQGNDNFLKKEGIDKAHLKFVTKLVNC